MTMREVMDILYKENEITLSRKDFIMLCQMEWENGYNLGSRNREKQMSHQLKTVNRHLRCAEKRLTEMYKIMREQ